MIKGILERGRAEMGEVPDMEGMEEAFMVFLKREEKGRLVAALKEVDRDLGKAADGVGG